MPDKDFIATLVKTCSACPEQYDVLDGYGDKVGYIRLRHGYFRVDAEPSSTTVFERSFPVYDSEQQEPEERDLPDHHSDGIFEDQDVREAYLTIALRKLAEHIHVPAPQLSEIEIRHF